MQFVTDFIDFIVSTVTSVWDFFQNVIENFLLFFKYLSVALSLCFNLITQMPSWLQVFGTITITVSILYLLIGRTTGGQKE